MHKIVSKDTLLHGRPVCQLSTADPLDGARKWRYPTPFALHEVLSRTTWWPTPIHPIYDGATNCVAHDDSHSVGPSFQRDVSKTSRARSFFLIPKKPNSICETRYLKGNRQALDAKTLCHTYQFDGLSLTSSNALNNKLNVWECSPKSHLVFCLTCSSGSIVAGNATKSRARVSTIKAKLPTKTAIFIVCLNHVRERRKKSSKLVISPRNLKGECWGDDESTYHKA